MLTDKIVTLKDMLLLIDRALNSIDNKLKDHGEQVAYILSCMMQQSGKYSKKQIVDCCIAAMLHDIGAYKIEERKKLEEFEINHAHGHAVYGSLFIKHFSPMPELSNLVKYHHLKWCERVLFDENIPEEAFMIDLADRICILYLGNNDYSEESLYKYKNKYFSSEHIDLFVAANKKYGIIEQIKNLKYKETIYNLFSNYVLTKDEIISYMRMLSYAIDFRSSYTVIHTITVESIAKNLAILLNCDDKTVNTISISAMVHDIGKIAVPVEILEKPGKLTKEEFEIMKRHPVISHKILENMGLDEIMDIATLHHEKLDGTGYPYGYTQEKLSLLVRIVAVADIVSALAGVRSYKDAMSEIEIIDILQKMALNNKIDTDITMTCIRNYKYLMDIVEDETRDILNVYYNLMVEQKEQLNYIYDKVGK